LIFNVETLIVIVLLTLFETLFNIIFVINNIVCILIVVFCYLFINGNVYASDQFITTFSDSFSNLDFSKWYVATGEGKLITNNGLELSSENSRTFPYLYSKENLIPVTGNYFIEFTYNYPEVTDFAVGLGLGVVAPAYGSNPASYVESDIIQFQLWQGNNDGYILKTHVCQTSTSCSTQRVPVFSLPKSISTDHTLRFEYRGSNFKIFDNNSEIINNPYLLSIGKRPSVVWIGNPFKLDTNNDWTDITIKNIKIGKIEETNEHINSIIIPGLGASWDFGALLSGRDEGDWKIPSFITNYSGLVNSFKNAGYSDVGLDKNLFVFSYDWRRPLDVLADRLNSFILDNSPNQKVNLVGHSMGGLVARAYAQKYGTTNVNKIVTIGSPNKGTLKAYGPWEGAVIFDDSWWSKVALELTTHFGVIAGESNIQTVQRIVPSLKDLLPTYDFLVFGNNSPVPISSANKNTYLENLNNNVSGIDSLTTAIFSDGIQTDSLIKVVPHTDGDLSTWIDGKPAENPFLKANGDGTVTDFSAKGMFSNMLMGTGWHGELVTKTDNIQKIFSVLGLDQSKVIAGTDDSRDKVFVAALRSPGKLEVCNTVINKCNEELGYFDSINKIFLFPDYDGENLVVNVREDGFGDYKLHLGNIDDSAYWTEVGGKLGHEDQLDTYNIRSNNQILTATLVDEIPPTTPTITGFKNPALPCGSITNSKYNTVDWSDSTDNYELAGYEYFVDYPLPTGTGRGVWNPSSLWSASENYGSLNEGVHYIKVRAKDKSGNVSSWSNTCEITYDSITPELESLTEFSGWYSTSQTSTFKYYDVNLRHDNIDPSCIISTEGIAQTCTITPNVCDMAGNCNTDPQISNGANIDMTPPKAPSIFAYEWGYRIWVGWVPVKTATKYRVYYGTKRDDLNNIYDTNYSFWFSNVLPQGKYYIRVSAIDMAGNESLKSNIEKVIIKKHWWFWGR